MKELIKAISSKTDKVVFCGWIEPEEAIKTFSDCNLFYLSNFLAEPERTNDRGAIDVSERNFGYASWLYLDADKGLPEAFHKQPTKIVESSPGRFHVYWRVRDLHKKTLAEVKAIQARVSYHYRAIADQLKDPLRMLRLPGSTNHKHGCQVKLYESNNVDYPLDVFLDGLEPLPESQKKLKESSLSYTQTQWLKALADDFLPNQFGEYPQEGGRNNRLNAIAYYVFQDWASLIPPEFIYESLKAWNDSSLNPLPEHEVESVLGKFLKDPDATYAVHCGQVSDFDCVRRWTIAYRWLVDRFAQMEKNGKQVVDKSVAVQIRNLILTRILGNCGYSPRQNLFLCEDGSEINPRLLALSLEGDLIDSKDWQKLATILMQRTIEPVNEYFKKLPTYSKPTAEAQIKKLCCEIMGLDDVGYIQVRKWLILAAKRATYGLEQEVVNPYILMFMGEQGVGKSAFAEILGGAFHSVFEENGDNTLNMMRSLIVELAEWDRYPHSSQAKIKQVVTSLYDMHRHKYAGFTSKFNRLFSFCGTTNSDQIIKDPTGARRFLVVRLPQAKENPYDINWLKTNRDNIWASAKSLAADEDHKFSPEEKALVDGNKEAFYSSSPLEECLREWVSGTLNCPIQYQPGAAYGYTEVQSIVCPGGRLNTWEKSNLISVLTSWGWKRGSGYRNGEKRNWMVAPGVPPKSEPEPQPVKALPESTNPEFQVEAQPEAASVQPVAVEVKPEQTQVEVKLEADPLIIEIQNFVNCYDPPDEDVLLEITNGEILRIEECLSSLNGQVPTQTRKDAETIIRLWRQLT